LRTGKPPPFYDQVVIRYEKDAETKDTFEVEGIVDTYERLRSVELLGRSSDEPVHPWWML
jgi:hypothetical protein